MTELEGVILGIVASREPCSAYVVRERFARTPTWGWSSSKGAIYPAVKRLVARGLLAATPAQKGEVLTLTAKGRAALQSWLVDVREGMGGAPIDPLRTRISYIANLPADEQDRLLDAGEAQIRAALETARTSNLDAEARDRWSLEASRNGLRMQLETKLKWWRGLRSLLAEKRAEEAGRA